MNQQELVESRLKKGLEQRQAAALLGVSQPYLSLLESGKRKLTQKFAEKVFKKFELSPEKLPLAENWEDLAEMRNDELAEAIGGLGYPKFAHLKGNAQINPAQILFSALKKNNLDSRIAESLPWVIFTFPELDLEKLTRFAKMFDLQNRLGFVVNLARQIAERVEDNQKVSVLLAVETKLEKSRLLREDVLANESIT
ncbi:MAG TPA: helix-turn-helix transcriptional regulator, partial [Pyrinomonadaceae bacterium]|nr:helix-turn-helix transcriptional regulator [Pyrinomonadaceae bacterium]